MTTEKSAPPNPVDAVDDALLLQADAQLAKHPEAKAAHDDAKTKSDDRHEAVDKALSAVAKKQAAGNDISMADFDDDAHSTGDKLTLNDVTYQSVGQKSKSTLKLQG